MTSFCNIKTSTLREVAYVDLENIHLSSDFVELKIRDPSPNFSITSPNSYRDYLTQRKKVSIL